MATHRRRLLVYGMLLAVWGLVLVWQAVEHLRVREAARVELLNRARDISSTAGRLMNAMRRFGVVPRDRLETAFRELIKVGGVNSIALLNEGEDVVALVGEPIQADLTTLVPTGAPYWADGSVAVMNLVELGTNQIAGPGVTAAVEGERPNPVIVVTEMFSRGTNRSGLMSSRTEPPPATNHPPPVETATNDAAPSHSEASPAPARSAGESDPPRRRGRRGDGDGRPPFGRPFWMSEQEYKELLQKQGVHSFVIVLSTRTMIDTINRDLWLRSIIAVLATVSVVGCGVAWRNLEKSSDLQLRLVRASELTSHLKELNLAAAGLAHETRNPLNIIRGLAQLISRREDAPGEIRLKSREIVEETDRVTAQLNEFINYSRPREVRLKAIPLHQAVGDVSRALSSDLEDKRIRIQVNGEPLTVLADEQLFRQTLFNLLLNASQAVAPGGSIEVISRRENNSEASLEIRDDGPGVPPERRAEIFKPYFTTNTNGTGLGLAVVQQIVLAHGWEIVCQPNDPRGACFRITHLRLTV